MPLSGKTLVCDKKNNLSTITLTLTITIIFQQRFFCEAGFFHDEIEIPERVTKLVIRLSGCLHTSSIIANSVKNSTEFLSLKWGFLGFCLNSNLKPKKRGCLQKTSSLFLYRGVWKITLRLSPSEPSGLQVRRSRRVTVMLLRC